MDPQVETLLQENLLATPIHELQEVAEGLVQEHGLSEQGLVKLSDQIKNVHDHKSVLMRMIKMLFDHLAKATTVAKAQSKIIDNLEVTRANEQKLKRLHIERDERRVDRNKALVTLLRARNDKVIDAARERNSLHMEDLKRSQLRRSRRFEPYNRKTKNQRDADNAAANKMVAIAMPMNEVQLLLRALDD